MIQIYQTRFADKDNKIGNCFAACIASVLDMPLRGIPDFFDGMATGQEVTSETRQKVQQWFKKYKLYFFEFGFRTDMRTILNGMKKFHPGPHYLLTGSCHGCVHTVVAQDDNIVHDPAVVSTSPVVPLLPLKDECLHVGIIGKYL